MARGNHDIHRRKFLAGAAAGVGGATVLTETALSALAPARASEAADAGSAVTTATTATTGPAGGTTTDSTSCVTTATSTVTPSDPQYPDVTVAVNPRFTASPQYVYVVDDPSEIAPLVAAAWKAKANLTVRSGGHCFENFVYNSSVNRIIDMSNMKRIYYDPTVNAIAVEPGVITQELHKKCATTWGTVIPGGNCYSVGMGGHVAGGGWGWLVRRNGLIVDHLYAVEVVTVDAYGNTHTILATNNPSDPNYQLWWAHTGGGGGNFGVVTRYFFRSPGATGTDPRHLLPPAPTGILSNVLVWDWSTVTQADFAGIINNYANWHIAHSSPTDASKNLTSVMQAFHKSGQQIALLTAIDAGTPNAQSLLNSFITSMTSGVVAPVASITSPMTWLQWTKWAGSTEKLLTDPTLRAKYKSAYFKTPPTAAQIATLYGNLTDPTINNPNINLNISPYGGATGAVPDSATAIPHRTALFKVLWSVQWTDPAQDAVNIAWARNSYKAVFASTGGVPTPNANTDGCYINYVDADMGDPTINTSGTSWSELYYKGGYAQLQAVKKKYDPTNFFHHAMSVELPS